jgi:hypothetical protein
MALNDALQRLSLEDALPPDTALIQSAICAAYNGSDTEPLRAVRKAPPNVNQE